MNITRLKRLIKSGESEKVEFKSSFCKEAIESVSAFANTKGGTVIVGVSNDGTIVGVSIGDESFPIWLNEIKQCEEIGGVNAEIGGVNTEIGGVNTERTRDAIVRLIDKNPGIKISEIADSLRISKRTVERWVSILRKQGAIEYRGSSKTGGYYIGEGA